MLTNIVTNVSENKPKFISAQLRLMIELVLAFRLVLEIELELELELAQALAIRVPNFSLMVELSKYNQASNVSTYNEVKYPRKRFLPRCIAMRRTYLVLHKRKSQNHIWGNLQIFIFTITSKPDIQST